MTDTCDLVALKEHEVAIVPAEQDLAVVRGTDNTFEACLTDGRGDPVDITLDTVKLTARDKLGGTSKLALSNGPGAHKDPANGITEFTLTREITLTGTIAARTFWVYEIRRVLAASGDEQVYIQGSLIINPSVGDAT